MKNFNSYIIDDVKSESEISVLMEMTELLLKQYEMSNYYYMEAVKPSKGNNPVDQPVTTPAPAPAPTATTKTPTSTPPTAKPSAPAKPPTGDLTSNPSANNTNTSNQQQKPEEQKGFIGFLKKIGNAISNWVKKIIDFITGNNKKKTEESINNLENAVVQTKEVVGNDEQSKEKLEGLASSNKFDEFLEKMGFKNINFEKVKKIAIEAITMGTITSVITTELRALVSGLVLIAGTDITAKEAGADPLTTAEKGVVIAETHKAVWITDFKNKLEGIISFVQKTGTEATLTIEQFKETFKQILDKLNFIKPIMEKIQQHTQEKVKQSEGGKQVAEAFVLEAPDLNATAQPADDSAQSDTKELAETLETCKKTFWLITFIQNMGNAILALIQHIGDLFRGDKNRVNDLIEGEGGSEDGDVDYSAMVEKDETYQPPENPQVSAPPTNAPENPQINTTDNVSQQSQSAPQSAPQSENQQATSQTIPASTELPPEQEEKYQQQLNQIADKENAQKEVFAQLNAGKLSSEIDSQLLEKAGIPQSMLDNLDASTSMSRSLEQRNRELQNQLRGGSARQ